MARVTIEDCVRYYPNRFEMVVLASRRARQLQAGMPSVLEEEGHKPAVQALKELGEGYVSWENVFELEEQERQHNQASANFA
ncbi:MAG: DNA-directed RNA polymerase subunit omega [Zetaproteobacteria bacterium CG2_30_46_52]|nr:MAG: DNA-directed RNA polymerase subunit omega [Zetaproteobacteria bacterium CG2_30_46_52]